MDANVTRGNLKNLVTDKPAPITVALAQKSDSDNVSTLFDSNVTRGNLKNLVTDKPAPITVALAQLEKSDKKAPAHSMLLQLNTLPDDVLGAGSTHTVTSVTDVKANGKTTQIDSNGDNIPKAGVIRVDGDNIHSTGWDSMEVHGKAVVGGTNVEYHQGAARPLAFSQN
jgi:hypothetical protein